LLFAPHGRQALLFGAFVASSLLAAVKFSRDTPPITTVSDIGVIELYTDLATKGRLFVGPYSRFGWHHPGPMYFYLQAPMYALSGHKAAALYAGALTINLGALILLTLAIARENRGWLLVLVPAAAVVFAWRSPRFLASPWTAHVAVLPLASFVALCAATASRRPTLLPLTLAVGSFVAQTHLEFAPVVGTLSAATIAALLAAHTEHNQSIKPTLAAAASLCVLLWLFPIGEALSHAGGNVAALWHFFVAEGRQAHTFREAVTAWSYGLSGVFRTDFTLPWGGHFVPGSSWWVVACSLIGVLLLPVIALTDLKAGRRFEACLAIAAFVACGSGLWALTRVRDDILDHEIFWLSAFGPINAAIIGAAVLRALGARRTGWKWGSRPAVAGAILTVFLGAAIGLRDLQNFATYELTRLDRRRIVAAYSSIHDYLRDRGIRKPLIEIDEAVWSQAAGVLVKLQRDRTAFALPADALPLFTDSFAANGMEDAQISIASRVRHRQLMTRPDNTVVFESDPVYIDAIRAARAQVR